MTQPLLTIFKDSLRCSLAQAFFVICLLVVIFLNLPGLKTAVDQVHVYKQVIDHQNIGYKFKGLEQFVEGAPYIGYFTDKNLKDDEAGKDFAQAQYMLSPSILDLNNLEHEYIIFACSKEEIAWKKIKEINAEALRRNQLGVILARRPLFNSTNP